MKRLLFATIVASLISAATGYGLGLLLPFDIASILAVTIGAVLGAVGVLWAGREVR